MSIFRRRLMMIAVAPPQSPDVPETPESTPSGVVWYDSLITDGTAYINTNAKPTLTTSVEVDFTRGSSTDTLFGCRAAYASNYRLRYYNGTRYRMFEFKNDSGGVTLHNTASIAVGQRAIISVTPQQVSTNNLTSGKSETISATYGSATDASAYPMFLFCHNNAGEPDALSVNTIHSFKVYDNGELTHHFRPCTYNGTPGMWEIVEGKFYGNANSSGEFSVA